VQALSQIAWYGSRATGSAPDRLGIEDVAQPVDGVLDAFGEVGVGSPAQHPARPGRVQCARMNLAGAGLGVIGRTRHADGRGDQLVQLGDRRLYAGADVEGAIVVTGASAAHRKAATTSST
jgi:hypothetical protein